jgi:E3 ubiquitin-protein ligase RNF115/126
MPSFMRRSDDPTMPSTPGDIPGPMMAQYLLALLGGLPHRHTHDGDDPFAAMFGPESGRWGDYAFSQEALDRIISEIMENSNAHRPVPAPDDLVEKLPRETLVEGCESS